MAAVTIAYDTMHYLVTFGGYLVNGREQWQCGLRYAPEPGVLPEDHNWEISLQEISTQDIWTAVKTVIQASTIGARWDTWTSLEFAKVAVIRLDGRYFIDPKEHRQQAKGTVNSAYASPPQLAVAASLSSGTKIGHANHGRFFLPCPSDWVGQVDPNSGQIVTASVNALRAALKTMLDTIGGEVSTVGIKTDLVIMSPKTPKSVHVTAPSHKKVTQLGIGYTVDTQRSRRRSLPDGITTWSTLDQ